MTAAQRQTVREALDRRTRLQVGRVNCDTPSEKSYNRGCRCRACREAALEARRKRRLAVRNTRSHGYVGYSNGCRCDKCRQGHAAYQREARRRRKAA